MQQTFETPGPLALRVEIPSDEIEVSAAPGTQTILDLDGLDDESARTLGDVRVELRDARGGGHELIVEAKNRKGWGSILSFGRTGYRVKISCPEGAATTVRSRSADVRGRGRLGSVDVESASGDVSFDEVGGDAIVKSASGDIDLGTVEGRATAHTAAGDVEIRNARGAVGANSVSGDVVVRDACGDVTANSVSGDQKLEAVVEGVVKAQSVSGDVEIGVRRGSRVYLDCSTLSGETSSELELTGDAGDEGPLVELRAKTVSGDISILRAAAVPEEVRS